MDLKKSITNKAQEIVDEDVQYKESQNQNDVFEFNQDCSGIVTNATVIYFEIKGIETILKENGKRIAVKNYKLYYNSIREITNENGGILHCLSYKSFLIIYPTTLTPTEDVVKTAMKIVYAFTQLIKEQLEQLGNTSFGIGIDKGSIFGTKVVSNNNLNQIEWFGTPINKSMRICAESLKPFYIGISGHIFHSLNDEMKTAIRPNIIGLKKEIEIWSKVSYEYDNSKRHLYQTNLTEPIED